MRFKEFLIEGKFTSSIRHNKKTNAIKFILNNCSEYLKSDTIPIFRGFPRGDKSWYIAKPSEHTRTSKSDAGGNIYTLLMDSLPEWKKYPKRSNSLVCATLYGYAAHYGSVHLVIPFDGAKWGVCQQNDIWHSFNNGKKILGLSRINEINLELIKCVNKLINYSDKFKFLKSFKISQLVNTKDPKQIWELLDSLEMIFSNMDEKDLKYLQKFTDSELLKKFIIGRYEFKTIKNIIQKAMDPTENEFQLITTKSGKIPEDREVWTDSNCILISPQSFVKNEMTNYLENKYSKMYPGKAIRNMVEDEIYEMSNSDYERVYKWLKEQV